MQSGGGSVRGSAGHMIRGITCPRCHMTAASHIRGFSLLLVIYHTSLLFKYYSVLILYSWNFRSITWPRHYLSAASLVCGFSIRWNFYFIIYLSCHNTHQTAKARLDASPNCCLLLASLCGVVMAASAGHIICGITCPRCQMTAASHIRGFSLLLVIYHTSLLF